MAFNDFNPNSNNDNDTPTIPPIAPTSNAIGMPPHNPKDEGDPDFDPDEFLVNYNEKFKDEQPTLFRDSVIQQTLSCLIGKYKANALLIGAAGVGKTKIVEDIARRIANNDATIPDQLMNYTIYELPLSNIVSGSGLVGEIERKTRNIIKFASCPSNKVILFIDEIHMLIGEDRSYDKIAQLLKPALSRGDLKLIGATTLQESQSLMDDPAFNRRFTRLIVDELSKEQTRTILEQMKVTMFNHYNKRINLNDKVLDEIVLVADEFKSIGSHRPDNAITLLDRAMADAYIQRQILESQLANDPAALQALQSVPTIPLSRSQMKRTALKLMTGNNEKTETDMNTFKDKFNTIKGQDDVINFLTDCIERDQLNIYPREKPLTLLFAGNSGVGKSEIAKILASEITNSKPIILNMTEYHSPASINRIIGSPAGYVGSESKTELPFDMLESNPYQLILLDEFEKADKSVQRLFMSAFDEGYIKTSKGKTVDFSKTIIIATTNAGHTTKGDSIGFTSDETNDNTASIAELSAFFDIEMLNRFTKILNFRPITEQIYKEILADVYRRKVSEIKKLHSSYTFLSDELSEDDTNKLADETYAKEFGARPAKKTIQKFIEDAIINYNHTKNTNTDNDVDAISA